MSMTESPPAMEQSDIFGGFVSLPYLVATIGSGFLILKWIYRTNRNAHLRSEAMTVSPGWSVGWFFIPIALLWKPYTGVRETWQVSQNRPVLEGELIPLLRRWWTWWVVVSLLGNISLQLDLRGGTVGSVMAADILDIISAIASVPLTFSLIAMIRALTAAQVSQANAELFA